MTRLLPDGKFCGAGEILGKHYKYTTFIWRALGAKVGERIFGRVAAFMSRTGCTI